MGLPTVGLFTFFSYDPLCLYPETYPDLSTMSSRPAFPFPRPDGSKRSLCEPVNLEVSVSRLTVGEATALCGGFHKEEVRVHLQDDAESRSERRECVRTYRDPCYDGRLPLDQLEDLGLGLLRALLLVLLPGQLGERHLELVVRDVAGGFLPVSRGRKRSF